ncbi:MAG: hypothetical protein ACP5P0_03645 [Hydrogenobacter sp.]
MKKLFFFFFVLVLGCAPAVKLVPLEDGLKVDKEKLTSIYEDKDVQILVKTHAWKYSPSDLPYYVLPIYLEVKNLSTKSLYIERQGVHLIDDENRQYNPIPPGDVSSMLGGNVRFSFGIAYYSYPYWFGYYPYYPYYPPTYPDIVNNAFLFGTLEPGAILKGFVYFQKPTNYQKRVILRVEYRIDNETKKVSFPFEVQR